VSKSAQEQLSAERRLRAKQVVDRFQWITAATVFTNPIPALDLMATGAVQFQMISEIAGVYGVDLSTAHVKMIGSQDDSNAAKARMVEAATSLIAECSRPRSSVRGRWRGAGVTMAYLTHISGLTSRVFRAGQTWGDGGMQAALVRQSISIAARTSYKNSPSKLSIAC